MSEIEKFWKILCTGDFEKRGAALKKWKEFLQRNPVYFENMQKRFSKKFYKMYSGKELHDFNILNIEVKCNTMPARKSEIKILLHDVFEDYGKDVYFYLIYRDVRAYTLGVPCFDVDLPWYGAIFEEVDEEMLKHRISLIGSGYIEITFKKISMIRVKKEDINI